MSDDELRDIMDEAREQFRRGASVWLCCPLDGRCDPELIARDLQRAAPAVNEGAGTVIGPSLAGGRASMLFGLDLPASPREFGAAPRRNEEVRAELVHLFGPSGREIGLMTDREALAAAECLELDLVELARGCPSTCQLLNYGLRRYESLRLPGLMRARPRLKELRLRARCEPRDLERKIWRARSFLRKGHPVRLRITARARDRLFVKNYEPLKNQIRESLHGWGVEARRAGEAEAIRFDPPGFIGGSEEPGDASKPGRRAARRGLHLSFPYDRRRLAAAITEIGDALSSGEEVTVTLTAASWGPGFGPAVEDAACLIEELDGATLGGPVRRGLRSLVLTLRPAQALGLR